MQCVVSVHVNIVSSLTFLLTYLQSLLACCVCISCITHTHTQSVLMASLRLAWFIPQRYLPVLMKPLQIAGVVNFASRLQRNWRCWWIKGQKNMGRCTIFPDEPGFGSPLYYPSFPFSWQARSICTLDINFVTVLKSLTTHLSCSVLGVRGPAWREWCRCSSGIAVDKERMNPSKWHLLVDVRKGIRT